MKDTIEIRWHGRGGQGAKTAALLLADVAFKTGKEPDRNTGDPAVYGGCDRGALSLSGRLYL